jgi:hypothetical protein
MVNIMLPLRGAQAVFTIVVLGLTAYGISHDKKVSSNATLKA